MGVRKTWRAGLDLGRYPSGGDHADRSESMVPGPPFSTRPATPRPDPPTASKVQCLMKSTCRNPYVGYHWRLPSLGITKPSGRSPLLQRNFVVSSRMNICVSYHFYSGQSFQQLESLITRVTFWSCRLGHQFCWNGHGTPSPRCMGACL